MSQQPIPVGTRSQLFVDDYLIAVSEGAEASAPFYPDQKPIDAYDVAILDELDVETKLVQSPRSKVQSP